MGMWGPSDAHNPLSCAHYRCDAGIFPLYHVLVHKKIEAYYVHESVITTCGQVMNMITIDAHSRDVVEGMVAAGAASPDSFQWKCQLRSVWDADLGDCRIRICDANFPYGYSHPIYSASVMPIHASVEVGL